MKEKKEECLHVCEYERCVCSCVCVHIGLCEREERRMFTRV